MTDKEGKQVTNLRPEEFEVIENGRKQPITNVSFISIMNLALRGRVIPNKQPIRTREKANLS